MEIVNKNVKEISESISDKIKIEKAKFLDSLLKDPLIIKLMKDNNLDNSFVEKHLIEFLDISKYNKECHTCKGYANCHKIPKGFYKWFNKEENIIYSPCRYYKELSNLVNGYILRDFKDEWLTNSLEEIMLNSNFSVSLRKELSSIALNPLTSKGLYLFGGPLTGKSFILVSLTNSLVNISKLNVCFVKFKDYLDDLKANFGNDSYVKEKIDFLKNSDVVVIDDLGSEKPSEWSMFDVLQVILDYRIENSKLTLFSSRYSLIELAKTYGGIYNPKVKRIIDSINALGKEIELKQMVK